MTDTNPVQAFSLELRVLDASDRRARVAYTCEGVTGTVAAGDDGIFSLLIRRLVPILASKGMSMPYEQFAATLKDAWKAALTTRALRSTLGSSRRL